MTSQQVVDYTSQQIAKQTPLSDICESICSMCLAPGGLSAIGCDNVTIVICAILNGKTKQEWYEAVKNRYEANPVEEVTTSHKFD